VSRSLSVVVPALNEALHVRDAVDQVRLAVDGRFEDWEILLFDDGSTDETGAIMDALAADDPRLRVTHNPRPNNLGGVYAQGVDMARMSHLVMIPGDNENPASAMIPVFDAVGRADIILPYPENSAVRGIARDTLSRAYTRLFNLLFGLDVPYFNGTVVHRTDLLRAITIETTSFAYQAEILIKLLRRGASWAPVGIEIAPQPDRESKALTARNLYGVARAMVGLLWETRVKDAMRTGARATR